MESFKDKLKSRKFIVAMIAQIVGVLILLFPDKSDQITHTAQSVSALVLMTLTAMGYLKGQSIVDAEQAKNSHKTTPRKSGLLDEWDRDPPG